MKPIFRLFLLLLFLAALQNGVAQQHFFKRYYNTGYNPSIFNMPDSTILMFRESLVANGVEISRFDFEGNPLGINILNLGCLVAFRKAEQDVHGNWILLSAVCVTKLDPSFNVLWSNTLVSPTMTNLELLNFDMADNDSTYYITGNSDPNTANNNSSLLLMKLNNLGFVQWSRSYGALNTTFPVPMPTKEFGTAIKILNDGNILVGGTSDNDSLNIMTNLSLYKFDPAGNLIWTKIIRENCTPALCDLHLGISHIEETVDNSLLLGGAYNSSGPGNDIAYIIKTDSVGQVLWDYEVFDSRYVKFLLSPDNAIYFACDNPGGIYQHPRIDKLNSAGQLLWSNSYKPNNNLHNFTDIIFNDEGGLFGCGGDFLTDPAYIFKTDSLGSTDCFTFSAGTNLGGLSNLIVKAPDFPYNSTNHGIGTLVPPNSDLTSTFTQYVYCGTTSLQENEEMKVSVFPNPADTEFSVSGLSSESANVEVVTITGDLVSTVLISTKENYISVSQLSSGVYFLKIRSENNVIMKKLIVQ